MKKFLMLGLSVAVFCMMTAAQSAVTMPLVAGDTVVNGATVTKGFVSTGGYSCVGITAVLTKIDGTVGGTVTFQGSHDNSHWETIGTAFTPTNVADQSKSFTVTGGSPYTYYRVTYAGTGTMRAVAKLIFVQKLFSTQ